MKFTLDMRKSVHENASIYFEKAKKSKKKIESIQKILAKTQQKLSVLEKKEQQKEQIQQVVEKKRKREWYEKFRWFYASNGMLVIGGRDATTNEIVIKKHTQTGDLVFHTDMAGSPFFVIKADSQQIDEQVRQEVATLTIVYSRAWQMKLSSIDVFSVLPEQVSKQAQAGESLSRGSFVIRGKTTYYQVQMDFCIGVDDQFRVHVGTQDSIKKHTTAFVRIVQGDTKTSEIAKQLRTIFGGGDLDEYIRQLPTGGCKIVREPEKFAR